LTSSVAGAFRPQGNMGAGRPGGGGCNINVSSVAGLIANVTTFGDPAFISAGALLGFWRS